MKTNVFFLLLLSATVLCIPAWAGKKGGTHYYFDAAGGNDSHNGRSEKKAWKTLSMLRTIELKPGDRILLNRGSVFRERLNLSAKGSRDKRIIVDAYGSGKRPCISAPDSSLFAIRIFNSDYVTVQNLEVVNKGSERMDHRVGVKIACENHGVSRSIILNNLEIHDVNGGLLKNQGEGSGIMMEIKGKEVHSRFDSLRVENCIIRRCERNAIIWKVPSDRASWFPSTHVVFRKNLIEEVPGDGIVPIACDGVLVEYNLMRNCSNLLPEKQAAAGMWPWSCDNAVFQFNEVSDHKAPWDGQGFDSDYNCTNTTLQYNYSHHNDGGFALICNAGKAPGAGNTGTVVQYNISINDAVRPRETHAGVFSPTLHIAGPCENTLIRNNIFHANRKPHDKVDRKMIVADSWDGYANNTVIKENVFYTPEASEFKMTRSTGNTFEGNYYLGSFDGMPEDSEKHTRSALYESLLEKDSTGFEALAPLLEKIEIADGEAHVTAVNPKALQDFFVKMKNTN